MGPDEHAPRAMDFSATERSDAGAWGGEHGALRRGCFSFPRPIDGEAAGVDAQHEWSRDGEGCAPRSARTGAAERSWVQLFWRRATTARTEMGCASDAAGREAGRAQAANASGARCIFEFDEGQSAWSDRVRGQARAGRGGYESSADAAYRRRMEISL